MSSPPGITLGDTGSTGLRSRPGPQFGGPLRGKEGPCPQPQHSAKQPHLPQLFTRRLVLGALTQVLDALVLGQEVLLLGIHLIAVPLVQQFAVGQRADAGLVAQLWGSTWPHSALLQGHQGARACSRAPASWIQGAEDTDSQPPVEGGRTASISLLPLTFVVLRAQVGLPGASWQAQVGVARYRLGAAPPDPSTHPLSTRKESRQTLSFFFK